MVRDFKILDRVRCYEGYRGSEKPLEFLCNGEIVKIDGILFMWVEEDGRRFFKVRDSNKKIYVLCFDEKSNKWYLIL